MLHNLKKTVTWYDEYIQIIDLLFDKPILLAWSVAMPNVARNVARRANSGEPSFDTVKTYVS